MWLKNLNFTIDVNRGATRTFLKSRFKNRCLPNILLKRKFSTTFYWGKHPFKDEGKLVFNPPHLNLTFAHKSQGGPGPPLVCPEGKMTITAPPLWTCLTQNLYSKVDKTYLLRHNYVWRYKKIQKITLMNWKTNVCKGTFKKCNWYVSH